MDNAKSVAEGLLDEAQTLRQTSDGYVRRSELAAILENVARRLSTVSEDRLGVGGQNCPPHTFPQDLKGMAKRCIKCGFVDTSEVPNGPART